MRWPAGRLLVEVAGPSARLDVEVRAAGALLVLRDETSAPAGRDLDLRGNGVWLSVVEEGAGRWSVGLEGFALLVDHPDDAVGAPTPLLLDLEWEAGRLRGEVRAGDEREPVDTAAVVELEPPASA